MSEAEALSRKDKAIEAIKTIIDPELFIDIWTLGLIYEVQAEDADVRVKMTFTSMACPAGPQLVDQVRTKLMGVEDIDTVEVEVVFDPPWEPSEELKALMGMA